MGAQTPEGHQEKPDGKNNGSKPVSNVAKPGSGTYHLDDLGGGSDDDGDSDGDGDVQDKEPVGMNVAIGVTGRMLPVIVNFPPNTH
jgi:hypothetical protein